MCKIAVWNVQDVITHASRIKMAKQKLAANGIDVISASIATHPKESHMAIALRYARKQSTSTWMA